MYKFIETTKLTDGGALDTLKEFNDDLLSWPFFRLVFSFQLWFWDGDSFIHKFFALPPIFLSDEWWCFLFHDHPLNFSHYSLYSSSVGFHVHTANFDVMSSRHIFWWKDKVFLAIIKNHFFFKVSVIDRILCIFSRQLSFTLEYYTLVSFFTFYRNLRRKIAVWSHSHVHYDIMK